MYMQGLDGLRWPTFLECRRSGRDGGNEQSAQLAILGLCT